LRVRSRQEARDRSARGGPRERLRRCPPATSFGAHQQETQPRTELERSTRRRPGLDQCRAGPSLACSMGTLDRIPPPARPSADAPFAPTASRPALAALVASRPDGTQLAARRHRCPEAFIDFRSHNYPRRSAPKSCSYSRRRMGQYWPGANIEVPALGRSGGRPERGCARPKSAQNFRHHHPGRARRGCRPASGCVYTGSASPAKPTLLSETTSAEGGRYPT
jgi:hypothetical protein